MSRLDNKPLLSNKQRGIKMVEDDYTYENKGMTPDSMWQVRLRKFENLLCDQNLSLNIHSLLDCARLLLLRDQKSTTSINVIKTHIGKLKSDLQLLESCQLCVSEFDILKQIGKGAFGDVHLVRHIHTDNVYALKTMKKSEMVKSDWIVKLVYAFQDPTNLYMVMEYVPGGDLVNLLSREDLNEQATKFYCAEIVLAIEAVHNMGYIHRDIKPDNILIDVTGHLKLTDFGTCIKLDPDGFVRNDTAIGTPDYICPEILKFQGKVGVYGKEIDWWSLGVVVYEMFVGETPFFAESLIGTYGKIMNHKESLAFPNDLDVSDNAKHFIHSLLSDRSCRLGSNGSHEVKSHSFFLDAEWTWDNIRQANPPFVPRLSSVDDVRYFDDIESSTIDLSELNDNHNVDDENFDININDLNFIGFSYVKQLMPFQRRLLANSKTDVVNNFCELTNDIQLNTHQQSTRSNDSKELSPALSTSKSVITYNSCGDYVSALSNDDYTQLQSELSMLKEQKEIVSRKLQNETSKRLNLEDSLCKLMCDKELEYDSMLQEIIRLKDQVAILENKLIHDIPVKQSTTSNKSSLYADITRNDFCKHILRDNADVQNMGDELQLGRQRRCVQLIRDRRRHSFSFMDPHNKPVMCSTSWSNRTADSPDSAFGSHIHGNECQSDCHISLESNLSNLYRSHLHELTVDAHQLANYCDNIQDDLDSALARISELNECVRHLKRARLKDETQFTNLNVLLNRSICENDRLRSKIEELTNIREDTHFRLKQQEDELISLKQSNEELTLKLERLNTCHKEIEQKYSNLMKEYTDRDILLTHTENELFALQREFQDQQIIKMEAVKKLENLLQNPYEIPYFSKSNSKTGNKRRDYRLEKHYKKLEQTICNERIIWSKEEERLHEEIQCKNIELKLAAQEILLLKEYYSKHNNKSSLKLNSKILSAILPDSNLPGSNSYRGDYSTLDSKCNTNINCSSRSSSVHQPKMSSKFRYSAYSSAFTTSNLTTTATDTLPSEANNSDRLMTKNSLAVSSGSCEKYGTNNDQSLQRVGSVFKSDNFTVPCEERLEGWLQLPSKHNIKRNGWCKYFAVAKSGRLSFYESDKSSLPWFHIPAERLYHVRPINIHDAMRVDVSLLPRIFQVMYDASINNDRFPTNSSIHSTISKHDIINHRNHEFMMVFYRKSTICDLCEKPCSSIINPPAAIECTKCHFKCHKNHMDSYKEIIPICKDNEGLYSHLKKDHCHT
ncbi:hypothetical protein GJ496_007251 [Pomphorhynchus laevis]|nr:hypothetical protein GJ496_007251 [Pomphorhynchus laevis]